MRPLALNNPALRKLFAVGMGAPYLVIGPFAGVLVDRWPIRAVLIWSNLGRAAITALSAAANYETARKGKLTWSAQALSALFD